MIYSFLEYSQYIIAWIVFLVADSFIGMILIMSTNIRNLKF